MMQKPMIDQIASVVEPIPGWTPLDQLHSLYMLALGTAHIEGDILEIGSWCGRSAVVLGLAASLCGNTTVYCVDLFPEKGDWIRNDDGSRSLRVQCGDQVYGAYHNQTVWQEPFERDILPIYERFSGTLEAFNHFVAAQKLEGTVKPFRGNLSAFLSSRNKDLRLRLAFIDGDHGYDEVSSDIQTVEQFLAPGAWLCFDDAFTTYEGVDDAIRQHVISGENYDVCRQLTRKLFVARYMPKNCCKSSAVD